LLKQAKIMGIGIVPGGSIHRRVDLKVIQADQRGAALIFATGPQSYVNYLREMAAQLGYKLSEDGLLKLSFFEQKDVKIDTENEQTIFDTLKIPYTDPEDRF